MNTNYYTVLTQRNMREDVIKVIITRGRKSSMFNQIEVLYLLVQYLRRAFKQ